MNVRELIEELQNAPENYVVYFDYGGGERAPVEAIVIQDYHIDEENDPQDPGVLIV